MPGGGSGLSGVAVWLFYGLLALLGLILVIAMFVYFLRRRPDRWTCVRVNLREETLCSNCFSSSC